MTNQAGKVARGLRTIGANITQFAQKSKEFEIQVNGAAKSIQLWNESGTDMLDTYEVLQQIAGYWDKMTNAEKASLAIDLAKKTQMDTFLAVMSNFEDAEKAYTTALLAEGSAWKENAAYMESIEAHQAQLKQQWSTLVLSMPFEDLEKALLDAGTALLKFANSDMGAAIAQATALVAGFGLLKTVIMSDLIPALAKLGAAALSNPIFLGTAALAGIIYAFDKLIITVDEATESLENLDKEITEQEGTVNSLEEQVDNIGKRIKEIEELKVTNPQDANALKQEEESLKRQEALAKSKLAIETAELEIIRKKAQIEANELAKRKDIHYTKYNLDYDPNEPTSIWGIEGTVATDGKGGIGEALAQQMANIEEFNARIETTNQKLEDLKKAGEGTSEEALELSNSVKQLEEYLLTEEEAARENAATLQLLQSKNAELDETMQSALNTYTEHYGALEDAANVAGMTEEEIAALAEEFGEAEDAAQNGSNALNDFMSTATELQGVYETLSKAADDYNKYGAISASTLKKLSELQPEYIQQLEVVNGKMQVSNGLLQENFEHEKQLAIIAVKTAKQIRIQGVCQEYTNTKTKEAGSASETTAPQVNDLASAFNNLAQEARLAGLMVEHARAAIAGDEAKNDALSQQLADIDAWEKGMIDSINAVEIGATGAAAKASKAGSKAAKETKDAWLEAFKEEKDALENLLETDKITAYEYYQRLTELNEKYFGEISGKHEKYIKEYRENEEEIYKGTKEVYDKVRDYLAKAVEQGYEKAINALKKEEKAVLDEIKKQINALKKEKDNVLKGIKKEIDALKKQKEAVQEYYNKQIDKIKEENSVLQEQNELLEYQQKLQQAKAQRVMVMENGKFTLTENESAVAQAEQALADYQDQISYEQSIQEIEDLRDTQVEALEDQIEALEEYYDYMEEWYDSRIEQMEEYYEQVEENYEKQIEALQNELDAFKEGMQKEEDLENARLAAQVLGMNERKDLYEEELENLKNYINEVNRMLASLGEAGVSVDYSYSPITGYHTGTAEVAAVDASISTRASGDASFKENSVALVGESPNTELLLGAKINSLGGGELMHLHKGTGIVNAESTSTLAGLLNGLATPQTNVANNRTTQQNFSFGNISLPNVTNAESFVNALSKQFNSYAIQYGNIRK